MTDRDPWAGWSDAALLEHEERLYDQEVEGENTWEARDEVLWEMSRRGLCRGRGEQAEETKKP